MNRFLEKIKIKFLDAFDKAVEFCREKWDDQRLLCIAVLALVLLVILLLLLIPSVSSGTGRTSKTKDSGQYEQVEIEPLLSIPGEPYIEDDYVYSRKNVTRWSEETVEEWFSEPDDEMLGDLKKANDTLIDDMMEVVP